jgi:tetratricopeptide (TPR) repeat protein/transcriptional regulator with XRE-family HTH domain
MEQVAEPALSFAGMLRQLRVGARLTQEELAEAAGLSPRSISDLERGINRTARKDSAVLLADALDLTGEVRERFVAAARGRALASEVLIAGEPPGSRGASAAATRTLPRDVGTFAGRETELARLLGKLADVADGSGLVGIHAIDGMAGIGKTTFAVHAAHKLAASFPDGQFFLPLHAHSPGQSPVTPEEALAGLLLTAGVPAQSIPPGVQARSSRWRDYVADKKILLLLDDVSGHDQVRPLLPGSAGSLVLVTSRRRLTALEDSEVISLDTLSPAEAAALLAQLSGRADLGSDAGPASEITRLCGYLPLAIGMLARQLRHHPARAAADLAADLAATSDRLAVMRTENVSVAATFELSYQDLSIALRRLFRRLGSSGPDIDAYAAAALDRVSVDEARGRLDELYDHHLITEPAPGRYLLHDLLREYARALAADDYADAQASAGWLVNYYAHVAATASKHIATWTTAGGRPPPGEPPAYAPEIPGPERAAAWLESERVNVHAALGYAAEVMPAHAVAIATAMGGYLRARGHWDQAAHQYEMAVGAARRAGDRSGEAGALDELGLLHQLTGDYLTAMTTLRLAQELYHDLGDQSGEAYALNHVGLVQQDLAEFPAAAASHQQALALALEAGDRLAEAVSRIDLGMIQHVTGDSKAASHSYQRALTLIRAVGSPFDEADVLCQLGIVQRETGDCDAAADSQRQSLEMFRRLGDRLGQSWALHEMGLVQLLTEDFPAAAASFEQALEIERELGSLHGQAWTLNSMGQLLSRTLATDEARVRHGEALAIARELGAPLQEAIALEGIGQSHLHGGIFAEAGAHLREALVIYQRLGLPEARRVQDLLAEHNL